MIEIKKIGYPRTANTFVDYIISNITNGYNRQVSIGRHGNIKTFWSYWSKNKNDIIVFTLRDYKECVPRHIEKYKSDDILKCCMSKENTMDYISLLKLYDSYEGPKILIYYEDLITNPKDVVKKLGSSLTEYGIKTKLDDFIKNINNHIENSKKEYVDKYEYGEIESNLTPVFHKKKISSEDCKKIDLFLETNYSELFKKYLERYKEEVQ